MTKREDQLRQRIHDVEEQLVEAAIMVTEARDRADAAEGALRELTEPISDAGHTTADGLRHELAACRKERDMLKAALERRGEAIFGQEGD